MLITVETLRDRRAKLAAERREIDKAIPVARTTLETTEAEFLRLNGTAQTTNGPRDAAAIARRKAQSALSNLQQKAADLDKEIGNLSRLLTGSARADEARKAIKTAEASLKAAEARKDQAGVTLANLSALVAAEGRTIDAARKDAAARVLEAVKAGADPAGAVVVNRDQLAAYEQASESAHAELQAAQAAVDSARAARDTAQRQLSEAEADDAELAHEIARAEYVAVLARAVALAHKAGRPASTGRDPREDAAIAAERI